MEKHRDDLFECLEWAKDRGYVGSNMALESLSKHLKMKFVFKETVWSGGTYYKIEKVK